jgi:hypothetical protein
MKLPDNSFFDSDFWIPELWETDYTFVILNLPVCDDYNRSPRKLKQQYSMIPV